MDKKIIRDKAIGLDALNAVKNEMESLLTVDKKVEDFINDRLSEVNKKVDSICADIGSIKDGRISRSEVIDLLKHVQEDVNNSLKQENTLLRQDISSIMEQLSRMEKLINSTNGNFEKFDQQINAIERKIDALNIERDNSQNTIRDYTEKTVKCVASFIEANRPIYSQLGEATKKLFKKIVTTAEQVKKEGTDIRSGVKDIIEKTLPKQPRTIHRSVNNNRETATYKKEETAKHSQYISTVLMYTEKYRFGRKNEYQRMIIAVLITLMVLFVLVSYVMISGKYQGMGLGTVKVLGIAWKFCLFMIFVASYLLKILLFLRILSTIVLMFAKQISILVLKKKTVILSIVIALIMVYCCRYINTNFYIPGRAIIRVRDILLSKDVLIIGYGINEVIEYWRMN